MFLIVGLGNPDKKYEKTRHNIGFDTIDALAEQYHITMNDHKHKALCGTGVIEGIELKNIQIEATYTAKTATNFVVLIKVRNEDGGSTTPLKRAVSQGQRSFGKHCFC